MEALFTDAFDAPPLPPTATPELSQIVTFSCEGRVYGLDIMTVREIRSWSPTTGLPGQAQGGCGVLDIRGEVVEIFDLADVLGHRRGERQAGGVIVVVTIDGKTLGIVVDSVSDIVEILPAQTRKVPESRGTQQPVSLLVKQDDLLVGVLDLGTVFPWLATARYYID